MKTEPRPCLSRRQFLMTGGATVSAVALSPALGFAPGTFLQWSDYPRKKIGKLSTLKQDAPVEFQYPFEDAGSTSFLVKLGTRASGGVGPDRDVVAFNAFCPHLGGLLNGVYQKRYKVAGPCPLHLTTFDLTRHGMLIAGHATESLPQVRLEVKGDDLYAVGILGLIYGKASNTR